MPSNYEAYIGLSRSTRERVKSIGKKSETYDQIVLRLLEVYETVEEGKQAA